MAVLNLKIDIKYLYLSFAYSVTVLYKNILKNEKNKEMENFHEKINVYLPHEVTKRVYFIGNERMLIAHDSNRLRFS